MNVCLILNVLLIASFFCNCAKVVVIEGETVVVMVKGGWTNLLVVVFVSLLNMMPCIFCMSSEFMSVKGGWAGLLVVVFVGLLNTMPCSSCKSSEFRSCKYQQACSRSVIRVFPR